MLEIRGCTDLSQEPFRADDSGKLGAEYLDGDLAVVPQVICQIHRRHSSRAELALDIVTVGESFSKSIRGVSHAGYNVSCPVVSRQRNRVERDCAVRRWPAHSRTVARNLPL